MKKQTLIMERNTAFVNLEIYSKNASKCFHFNMMEITSTHGSRRINATNMTGAALNPSYVGVRNDILGLVPENVRKVLDVGCSTGVLGEKIKQRETTEVVGVELDEQMAKIARENLDSVIVGDVEKVDLEKHFPPGYFDCIIFADILEHLKNPWDVLKNATGVLDKEGVIVASIPNVRHYTTIINLLFKGYWPYRERGIHDRTHLRFFTLKNIKDLFQCAGLEITRTRRNYRIVERPHSINKYARCLAFLFKNFLAFQYLVVAEEKNTDRLQRSQS